LEGLNGKRQFSLESSPENSENIARAALGEGERGSPGAHAVARRRRGGELRLADELPGTRRVKVTGLAQKLGQLEAVNRDLQSKSWANLKRLGQPCIKLLRSGGEVCYAQPCLCTLPIAFAKELCSAVCVRMACESAGGGGAAPVERDAGEQRARPGVLRWCPIFFSTRIISY
jgi:hypothetical protein